jgi:methylated-DNA-[protein]-cysteine S-methyltransferase
MVSWTQFDPAPGITLYVAASDRGICRISFTDDIPTAWSRADTQMLLKEAARQLTLYFDRGLRQFDLPLDLRSGTPFQRKVWNGLLEIPYGHVISYAELAKRVNSPKAFRAVGAANGRNPVPIVVPCHRVINADGGIGGYSCGLPYKRRLLELEGVHVEKQLHLLAHAGV